LREEANVKKMIAVLSLLCAYQGQAQTRTSSNAPQIAGPDGIPSDSLPTHLLLNLEAGESLFKPFTKDDFFSEDYNLSDYVLVPHFTGLEPITVKEYLNRINRSEKLLAQIGRSLRNSDPTVIVNALANPEIFYRQIANDIGLSKKALIEGVKNSLEQCPLIDAKKFAGKFDQKVEVKTGINVKIKDLIPQLNQQQQLFCSLGYTMFGDEINDIASFTRDILPKREEIMAYLDLGENHKLVQIAQWAQTLDPEEIKAQIAEIQEAIKNPSPALIYNLAQEAANLVPDAGLILPDVPRVDAPQLVKRTDLKLKKRYEWKGIHEGEPNIAQINIDAWAELRAGKAEGSTTEYDTEQAFQAEGKGGLVFLSQPLDIFVAQFDSGISPSNAKATVTACLLRACITDVLIDKQAKDWQYGDKILDESWDFPFAQQFFIGPIPVVVRAIVIASAYADWDLGFTLVSIDGGVKGKLAATAAAEGAVGLKDFVEAGAGAQMAIIDSTTTLRASALIASSESGAPFITGSLTGNNNIKAFNGSIYGYAMIDVMGPLGDYMEEIVDAIKNLGDAGQELIDYLNSFGSDLGKQLAKKVSKEVDKAAKNIGNILTGKKKLFKKPISTGVGYGFSITGTKMRYQQDIITWPAYNKDHRFLNYKLHIGPDGKEYGGDASDFSPEKMREIEQEIDLTIREGKVVAEEQRLRRDFAEFFGTATRYLNAPETLNLPTIDTKLQSAFQDVEARRLAALRKLQEVVSP